MNSRRLLIIEDDPGLQSQMKWCFEGCKTFTAGDAATAETIVRKEEPQVITLDLGLPPDPGGSEIGFQLLETLARITPRTKVIVITGREENHHAVRAVSCGAYDFYHKPIESETLQFAVERAFRLWELEAENIHLLRQASAYTSPLNGLITSSQNMLDVCRLVERVAPTDVNVMVLGETGTGKELVARGIHDLSQRSDRPFIVINCAAIPENLLESELFGHERGSFTGAVARKIGKIEAANEGTLFLDEIGDMALHLQAKILRFVQEKVIERVGGTQSIEVDVRVISATHQDLNKMIGEGRFREDLFFRVSEISLELPPLRDRNGDAILLANSFLRRYSPEESKRFSQEGIYAIEAWPWSGNVRELENRVKRACIVSDGKFITPVDLELAENETKELTLNLKQIRAEAERGAIVKALRLADNNVSKTSRMLGVSRPTLYNLFNKYDIKVETDD